MWQTEVKYVKTLVNIMCHISDWRKEQKFLRTILSSSCWSICTV